MGSSEGQAAGAGADAVVVVVLTELAELGLGHLTAVVGLGSFLDQARVASEERTAALALDQRTALGTVESRAGTLDTAMSGWESCLTLLLSCIQVGDFGQLLEMYLLHAAIGSEAQEQG